MKKLGPMNSVGKTSSEESQQTGVSWVQRAAVLAAIACLLLQQQPRSQQRDSRATWDLGTRVYLLHAASTARAALPKEQTAVDCKMRLEQELLVGSSGKSYRRSGPGRRRREGNASLLCFQGRKCLTITSEDGPR